MNEGERNAMPFQQQILRNVYCSYCIGKICCVKTDFVIVPLGYYSTVFANIAYSRNGIPSLKHSYFTLPSSPHHTSLGCRGYTGPVEGAVPVPELIQKPDTQIRRLTLIY